ncbi:MAG: hypothetical protein J6C09_07560 [Clostridia bacterium]|nr:hypothetical protein [Clostridia bacterium]
MKITQENYIQELIKTYTAAAELAAFSKKHPAKTFCLGRCNGKTRFAYLFLRYYVSINEAYDRVEKKISRRLVLSRLRLRLKYLLLHKKEKEAYKKWIDAAEKAHIKAKKEGSENEN